MFKGCFVLLGQQCRASLKKWQFWSTGGGSEAISFLDRTPAHTNCSIWSRSCCPAGQQDAGSCSISSSATHHPLMACCRAPIFKLSCFSSSRNTDWSNGSCSCYNFRPLLMLTLTCYKVLRFASTNTVANQFLSPFLCFPPGGWGSGCCCDQSACWDWLMPQVLNSKKPMDAPYLLLMQSCILISLRLSKWLAGCLGGLVSNCREETRGLLQLRLRSNKTFLRSKLLKLVEK